MRILSILKSKTMGLLLAAAILPTTGCGKAAEKLELAGMIPDSKSASINVPGGGGTGQALLGEQSDFYETTYNVSRGVNGTVAFVLELSKAIAAQDPTKVEGNTYTWGPSTPSGLEKISYRFIATKVDTGHWTFNLQGRPKASQAEEDFKLIYEGDVTKGAAATPNKGHGTLKLYFDNNQALEQKSCGAGNRDVLEGRASVVFVADAQPRSVNVKFEDFRNSCDDGSPSRQPATYLYVEAADGSGNFQFTAHGNIHKAAENKPLMEAMSIRSRWLATGKGRSDVSIGEGEVPADLAANNVMGNAVTATECWDENFKLTFQTTGPDGLPQSLKDAIRPTLGNASDCAFPDAALPEDV